MYSLPIVKFSVKIIVFRLNIVSSLKSETYKNDILRQTRIFEIKFLKITNEVFDSLFEQN